MVAISVEGSDLSEITQYDDLNMYATGGWRASKISDGLLQYLAKTYPFNSQLRYHDEKPSTKVDYEDAITRLQRSASKFIREEKN